MWPPDVFALVTSVLQRCGAYPVGLASWPPPPSVMPFNGDWSIEVRRIGKLWRKASVTNGLVPDEVTQLWKKLIKDSGLRMTEVGTSPNLCSVLMCLLAISDEASEDVGGLISPSAEVYDAFFITKANELLLVANRDGATVCEEIASDRIRVLPKVQTPQGGLTIRSLSHFLALCTPSEMSPVWHPSITSAASEGINLLVVPWPFDLQGGELKVAKATSEMQNMAPQFGWFTFDGNGTKGEALKAVVSALKKARKMDIFVHGVVLPECAVENSEVDSIRQVVTANGAFLVCGQGTPATHGNSGQNSVNISFPREATVVQHKHHRWKLNESQIKQYGLALDPKIEWWEYINVADRKCNFFMLRKNVSMACLICEDLARPDPVGNLIRAVGPNLVIALLLDGPQLHSRWPGRYASTLADDPGCSVLTVTSLGMVKLSKPTGLDKKAGKVVALWRDIMTGNREISLPAKSSSFVLHLKGQEVEQWTADGRSDRKSTVCVVYGGETYL